jgi:hypothetical protein
MEALIFWTLFDHSDQSARHRLLNFRANILPQKFGIQFYMTRAATVDFWQARTP